MSEKRGSGKFHHGIQNQTCSPEDLSLIMHKCVAFEALAGNRVRSVQVIPEGFLRPDGQRSLYRVIVMSEHEWILDDADEISTADGPEIL